MFMFKLLQPTLTACFILLEASIICYNGYRCWQGYKHCFECLHHRDLRRLWYADLDPAVSRIFDFYRHRSFSEKSVESALRLLVGFWDMIGLIEYLIDFLPGFLVPNACRHAVLGDLREILLVETVPNSIRELGPTKGLLSSAISFHRDVFLTFRELISYRIECAMVRTRIRA
jgi:hypothetical protein